jgi:hypothetical protein
MTIDEEVPIEKQIYRLKKVLSLCRTMRLPPIREIWNMGLFGVQSLSMITASRTCHSQ